MGLTAFSKKHPITPVILLCLLCFAFIVANSAGPSILFWERMQKKAKVEGLDVFDWVICVIYHGGLIGTTILAFRSRKWGDWQDQREQQKRVATETELARQQTRADFGEK